MCASSIQNGGASALHRRIAGIDSDQLERKVRLDRRAHVRRAAGIDRPATIGKLMILNVPCHPRTNRIGLEPQERQQQDVFRLEDRVTFQLGDPVAVVVLAGQQPVGRSFERRFQRIVREIGMSHGTSRGCPFGGLQVVAAFPVGDHALRSSGSGPGVPATALPRKTNGSRDKRPFHSTGGAHPT